MHKLLDDNPGREILLLGNEAIARGAIEGGVAFATTYPGTPSSEISLNLFQVSHETNRYFEYSPNEKVALEVAAAAANSGLRTMCIMKHVGLNVAADPLMTLAYVGVKGGLVIVTADDPAMFSSQNEQDNRYYARLSGLPMLEPSSISEAKEMAREGFAISEKLGEPVLLRTTTRVNHSSAFVTLGAMAQVKTRGDFEKDPFHYVTVPAVSRKLHVKLLENIEKAADLSENSGYNFVTGDGPFGIVCNGVSYQYVRDAVKELGIEDRTAVFRMGFSYPLPVKLIRAFAASRDKILVVEEGEPVMEEAVRSVCQEAGNTVLIKGKDTALFSRLYEFDPAMVKRCMATFFEIEYTAREKVDTADVPDLPQRPPNLCSGCSHRATFYEVKQACKDMDVMYPTDIGCYTLGFLPPLSSGDFLICMGSSVSTACGFSKATDKKVISYIGDSTFFHSGITGLVNAVFNNHKFTLVILDNGTTAMTGHQPHPGVDMSLFNLEGYNTISIEALVKSLGVKHVSVIQPFKVKKSVEAIREAVSFDGVSVIISREPCALLAKSMKLMTPRPFRVTDKCRDHRTCINEIACPSFYIKDGKVAIDENTCVGCAVCAQICPENAIVPLKKQG